MNPTLRSAGLTGLKCLNEAGYEAWWVGGCVRDALLERPVQDIDVTTSALLNRRSPASAMRDTW